MRRAAILALVPFLATIATTFELIAVGLRELDVGYVRCDLPVVSTENLIRGDGPVGL